MSSSVLDSLRQASTRSADGSRDAIVRPVREPGHQAPGTELRAGSGDVRVPTTAPVFIANVSFDAYGLYVRLAPAQEIAIPLQRLPSLAAASSSQRRSWQILDHGTVVAWPDLNLAITLTTLQQARHDPTCVCEQPLLETVR